MAHKSGLVFQCRNLGAFNNVLARATFRLLACWQEERVGFDNQLGAVERTLQAKIKDYEELLLLSGDANHAREVPCESLN